MEEKKCVLSEKEYLEAKIWLYEIQLWAWEVVRNNGTNLDLSDFDKLRHIKSNAGRLSVRLMLGEKTSE